MIRYDKKVHINVLTTGDEVMRYTLKKKYERPFLHLRNSIIIEVNNEFINFTGYSRSELIGKSLYEINSMLRLNSQICLENIQDECSCYMFTRSYEPKEVTILCKSLEFKNEKMYFLKEKVNSCIKDKFMYVEQLYANNQIGVSIFSFPDLILLRANQKQLDFFDTPYNKKENSIGRKPKEILTGYEGSNMEEALSNVMKTGEPYYAKEGKYDYFKRGATYWDISIVPIYIEGKAKYIVQTIIEVTEEVLNRKFIDEQAKVIKQQKEELEVIIENMSDGLCIVDKDYNYSQLNSSAREFLYYPYSMKKEGEALIHTKYYSSDGNLLQFEDLPAVRVLNGEKIKEYRLTCNRPDGVYHVSISGSPIYNTNGSIEKAVICLRDITEQERKDELIKTQNKQLEGIIENISDVLYIIDKDYNMTYLNSASRGIYGGGSIKKAYNLLKYNKYYDDEGNLLTFENLPAVRVLKGEKLKDYRYTLHSADGIYHFSFSGSPIYDNSGNVIKAIFCSRDITEQVNRDKVIRKQKEEFEAIIENMSDFLIVFDKYGKFTKFNKLAKDSLLFKATTLKDIGDVFEKFECYDEYGNLILKENFITERVLRGEKISDYKMYIKINNNLIHVEISYTPIYDSNSDFISGILIIRDVTDRVKSQETLILKKQLDLLNNMIENLGTGFVRYSYEEFKIIDINNISYSYLKQINPKVGPLSSIKGENYFDMVYCNEKNKAAEIIKNLRDNKSGSYFNHRKFIVDGEEKFLKDMYQPLFGLNNQIIEIVVITMDITEEVKAKNKIEEALKMQEKIFANVSHELKTPLNVIFSTNQLMEFYLKNNELEINKEKLFSNINIIKQNCYRFTKLINNIVDLSKIESGFYKLNLSNENIVQITEDIVQSISEYIKSKKLNIIFDTNTEEKIIACDIEKMERIILNLISNAIKFTNSDGEIFVNVFNEGDIVKISVKDTGRGIDKNHSRNIFERFYQVDKSLSRNAEGSGIGLSLVKSLVELHGGKISVESEVGHGSEFNIELPARNVENPKVTEQTKFMNKKIEMINIEFSDIYSI